MVCFLLMEGVVGRPAGGDFHMKWAGLLFGNFE